MRFVKKKMHIKLITVLIAFTIEIISRLQSLKWIRLLITLINIGSTCIGSTHYNFNISVTYVVTFQDNFGLGLSVWTMTLLLLRDQSVTPKYHI